MRTVFLFLFFDDYNYSLLFFSLFYSSSHPSSLFLSSSSSSSFPSPFHHHGEDCGDIRLSAVVLLSMCKSVHVLPSQLIQIGWDVAMYLLFTVSVSALSFFFFFLFCVLCVQTPFTLNLCVVSLDWWGWLLAAPLQVVLTRKWRHYLGVKVKCRSACLLFRNICQSFH